MATPKGKKKVKKNIATGIAHVFASFNNTVITITDTNGNAVSWSSCGARQFAQIDALRGPGRRRRRLPQGDGPRHEGRRSPREGSWLWS